MEYGIFNDEGLVEGGFYSKDVATTALGTDYTEDDCRVGLVCRGCSGSGCRECHSGEQA